MKAAAQILRSALSVLLAVEALKRPAPHPVTLEQRLAMFPKAGLPLQERTVIYWDEQQVPFIEAESDRDAAFALGLVHAHLRLGQLEIGRRLARGRVAEMAGPAAIDIDRNLRTLGIARAADEIEAAMTTEQHRWLADFVDGINHYQQRAELWPDECRILGIEREPWRPSDIIAYGRLGCIDVNWPVWFGLLRLRDRQDWPEIWARLLETGGASAVSYQAHDATCDDIEELYAIAQRAGSNSVAVAGRRTKTGGAMIASDPHLGIHLPNLWLIAGLKCPSYHVVGLMTAGLPFVALGRNPWIAWGGTNMRAASSDLFDVSHLPDSDVEVRQETLKVRWGKDRQAEIAETRWGPIISEAPALRRRKLPRTALKWIGHQPTNEIGAFIDVGKARDFTGFRRALKTYGAPALNMIYADAGGNIGLVMAVHVPDRDPEPPRDFILDPNTHGEAWQRIRHAGDLPVSYNPASGVLTSANNRPTETDVPIGYFFSPDDRVNRMRLLIDAAVPVDTDDLRALQRDVAMESASKLSAALLAKATELGLRTDPAPGAAAVFDLLEQWDGRYDEASRGALAFEVLCARFTRRLHRSLHGAGDSRAYAGLGRIKMLVMQDLASCSDAELRPALEGAIAFTAKRIRRYRNWGDFHRLRLGHVLSAIPIVGRRYRVGDFPVAGSTDTLMKTSHGLTEKRHAVRYGANARHISDLSDPDANYFCLLGGQDGWLGSENFADQIDRWRAGEYTQVPMSLEKVRAAAVQTMVLKP